MSPTVKKMRSVVAAMDGGQLDCRDLTHAWHPLTAQRVGRGFKRVLRCDRCGTQRHDVLDSRGGVRRRRYVYVDNYLVTGIGRLQGDTKNMMRLEALTRMLANDTTTTEGDSAT